MTAGTLDGQVALVTGAGRGIGKAVALLLADEGADVAVVDIDPQAADQTAVEVGHRGRRSVSCHADVSDHEQVGRAVADTVARLGRVDVLVNNAGIAQLAPFLEITPASWERHLAVHLSGTFFCSQAAARDMVTRGYGRIINMSSVAGLMGPIDLAAYGTAKAGIAGLTRAAALEFCDDGITVNAIAPGPIRTELLETWPEEVLRERAGHLPVARFGEPEEVARVVLFLASPASSFLTGTVVVVDGGSVAAGAYMVEKHRRRKAAEDSGSHT